jgi:hypothetical protein
MRHLFVLTVFSLITLSTAVWAQQNTEATPRGPFSISSGSQNTVWRIDQSTGLVSYCIRDTVSNDPALIRSRPPICSAWGR